MKFFKKTGVAIATLILSVAAALTIGYNKGTTQVSSVPAAITSVMEKESDNEMDILEAYSTYIVDDASVLSKEQENEIANLIANMSLNDRRLVACATQEFPVGTVMSGEDLDKTAQRLFDRLELSDSDALIFIDPANQCYYVSGGKNFLSEFSQAELNNFKASLEAGFTGSIENNKETLGPALKEAYDIISRVISNPSDFEQLEGKVLTIDDGELAVSEHHGFSLFGTIGGIFSGVAGVVKTIVVGAVIIVLIVFAGLTVAFIRSRDKKRGSAENSAGNRSTQRPPQKTTRNLSESGNIDTSKIEKQGSQYRWSANKNPYSGLGNGRSGQNGQSGFSFPGMGDGEQDDKNRTRS